MTAHTHQLTFAGDIVRKRYVSWDYDEPGREWAGLSTLAGSAPDLAPTPIARESEDGAPVIVMSRLPGTPLGSEPLTAAQGAAHASALRRLFAVAVGTELPERSTGPTLLRRYVREFAACRPYDLAPCQDTPLVRKALDAARELVASEDAELDRIVDPVAARGDGNLANYLWDGGSCRLVDFEEFGVSDLAFEAADSAEHASSRLGRLLDVEQFVDAMGLTQPQLERFAAFRALISTFWLVMMLPGNSGFARNPAGSTEDQARQVLASLS